MSRLDGAVLLTGATGGLGHAIARELAGRGARVVVSGRRREALEPLAAEIGGRPLAADLTDPVEVERLASEAGAVDVLVANAALPASGLLGDFSIAELDRALAVNLRAPMILAKILSAGMVKRGRGHLVFISSLAGKSAPGGAAIYSATKFGLRGFALALREDLRPHGVGVSTVFPTFIRDAGMFAETGVELPWGVGTRTPQDVARAVAEAIEEDRGEVDVAPLGLRISAAFAGLAPSAAAALSRRLGSERIATEIAAGQREKR